ncbi:MAG: hypothetical protein ACYS15_06280 [Planctomycetota bacterium]|jgi:hypothetical protein
MLQKGVTLLLAFGLVGVCATAGCAGQSLPSSDVDGPRLEPPPGREVGPDAPWPLWPQRMRVHPLSQFVTEKSTGDVLIEARIEFVDVFGDTCKAVGLIDIDLHDADAARYRSEAGTSWNADLWNLEVNNDLYDEVTRTYLFRLQLNEHPIPTEPELRVYFLSGDGKRLQAAYRLRSP